MKSADAQDDVDAALLLLGRATWTFEQAEELCPREPGLYALHPRDGGREQVWSQLGLASEDDDRPLYVGKAEHSLRGRDVSGHFTGGTGQSTVRRSLAALLQTYLELRACPRNPASPGYYSCFGLEADSEIRLSGWMASSLTLAVWPKGSGSGTELTAVERSVISFWKPPLNLTYAVTPSTSLLKRRRRDMADEARRWGLVAP